MKNHYLHFERLVQLILLFALTAVLTVQLVSGRIFILINPKYMILIYLSIGFLLLFCIYLSFHLITHEKAKVNVLKIEYFLLIIIMIIAVFPSYKSFQSRISHLKGVTLFKDRAFSSETSQKEKPTEQLKTKSVENKIRISSSETVIKTEGIDIVLSDENFLEELDRIYRQIDEADGASIHLSGFSFQVKDMKDYNQMICRVSMLCCAADSSSIGILIDSRLIDHTFVNNEWYELSGVIRTKNMLINQELREMPVIEITQFKKIDPPENPFVFQNTF